jgi:hypothetical protein
MRFILAVGVIASVLAVVGYIMNVAALVTATASTTLVELAIRIVGLFAVPVGVLAGWLL